MKQRFNKIVSGLLCLMMVIGLAPSGVVFAADMELSFPAEIVHIGESATIAGFSEGAVFASSDDNIATVDANGVVTGVAVGKATITATADGSSASIEVPVVGKNLINRAGNKHGNFGAGTFGIYFNNRKGEPSQENTIWFANKSSRGNVYDYERVADVMLPGKTEAVTAGKFSFDGNGKPDSAGKITLKLQAEQKYLSGTTDPENNNRGVILLDKGKLYELSGWTAAENATKLATDLSVTLDYFNCNSTSSLVKVTGFTKTPWAGKSGNQAWASFSTDALDMSNVSANSIAVMPTIFTQDASKVVDMLITDLSVHEVKYDKLVVVSPKEEIEVDEPIVFASEHYTNTGNMIKEVSGIENINVKTGVAYKSLNPDIIEPVSEGSDEFIALKVGTATIEATATIGGVTKTGYFEIEVVPAKGADSAIKRSSTYYTPEMIEGVRENAKKVASVRSTVQTAVEKAEKWLPYAETIYNMMPNHTIPRSAYLCVQKGTLQKYCMFCGKDIQKEYGNKRWNIDMVNRPWEIQCKNCKKSFPSNDFNAFYNNGLDENHEFDRQLALERNGELCGRGEFVDGEYVVYDEYKDNPYGYGDPKGNLYNKKFPELHAQNAVDPYFKNAKQANVPITQGWSKDIKVGEQYGVPSYGYFWGVDDGMGYRTGRKDGTVDEVHYYIAVANYFGLWYWHGSADNSAVYASLSAFRDAYLYTGDRRYAIAGAKILDRLADLYPDFHQSEDSPNLVTSGGTGRITGNIHENFIIKVPITAYDAFFDAYEEPALINFLSQKAEEWNLDTDKSSAARLRKHVEENILMEAYRAVKGGEILGNFGFREETLASAAIVLDNEDTPELIDFLMRQGPDGVDFYAAIIRHIDRDGYVDESSLAYNNIFANTYFTVFQLLGRYGKVEPRYDIASNPRAINGLVQGPDFILQGGTTQANIGDFSSAVQDTGITKNTDIWLYGVQEYPDNPIFAQMLYLTNGNTSKGLKYDMWTKNPEKAEADVQAIIDKYGPLDVNKSSILTGYGFGALRAGSRQDNVTSTTKTNTARDWWMYWGAYSTTHGHADGMNLGVNAFGLNFAHDIGYGASGSTADKNDWNSQWIEGTPSHNTVVVDDKQQSNGRAGSFPLHFDDEGAIKVMDADAPASYNGLVDVFRRTIVSIDIDETVSYALDFFRVVGGNEHVYAFHAASHESEMELNEGVALVPQTEDGTYETPYVGTYAGKDITYGQQYANKNSGYSWIVNVERAANPGKNFAIDFKVSDYQNFLPQKHDFHLKLTQVNGFELSEVARADGTNIPDKNNPEYSDYVFARRSGNNLDTLFTTVIEPYEDSSKINAITRVDVARADGTPLAEDEPVAAVKVELDGRTDYVVYSADNEKEYTVDGLFDFCGFVGVYTLDSNNEVARTYINDGTKIGDVVLDSATVSKGEVVSFTEGLALDNYIEVTTDAELTPEFLKSLEGKLIAIDNNYIDNATYVIETAAEKNGNLLIGTGDVDLARRAVLNADLSSVPNFAVGDTYRISNSVLTQEGAPKASVSTPVSAVVGSTTTIPISIECEGEYEIVGASLPRGMEINNETNSLTWRPTASQIGDNYVCVRVESGALYDTVEFIVSVYGSTTGGGGGGGGGADDKPEDTTKPEDTEDTNTPDDSENTDVNDNTGDAENAGNAGTDANEGFVDLGSHAWAEDAINALADAGIVKGTSGNTYSPANNITRADFTILLVRAFDLTSDNTENFADVSASDYFANELAIARNTGLVNGIGDNKYAPRNTITRQDMMVIVYRALTKLGVELTTGDVEYADFGSVAEYAEEAVKALITSGLVNGKSGMIAPTDYTTRAEVAVLLQRILDYVK